MENREKLVRLRSWFWCCQDLGRSGEIPHCRAWKLVKSDLLMRLLLLLAFFCFLLLLTLFCSYPGLGILPQTDSFRITSVWPPIDTKLHGRPVELHARIRYRLISMDRAMLSIGAERFWGTTQGCHDPNAHHHSEGGTRTLLKKGTGDVDVTFTWVGDVPSYSTVPRNVTTFVGMGMRLWPESLKPPSRFLGQSSFC